MNSDNKLILELYESISHLNFFNDRCSEEEFDWNSFFHKASQLNMFNTLLESINLVNISKNDSEKTEKYEIVTKQGNNFYLFVTYQGKKKSDVFIMTGVRYNDVKHSEESVNYLTDLQNKLSDDSILCFIRFEDGMGRSNITGEVGLNALEVFSAIKAAVLESFDKNSVQIKDNLVGIVVMVSKSESKRISLYTRIIKQYSGTFPNVLVDTNSDSVYTYIIASK